MASLVSDAAQTHPENSDAVLVLAAQAGDKAAFGTLIERHRPLLMALCRRTLGDTETAEDAVHEAILRALLSLDRLRSPERFGPWLGGIGVNICRSWLRERARLVSSWEALEVERDGFHARDGPAGPETMAEAADLADRIRRAIDALPYGQRTAVELFYVSDCTYAETARQLGIGVGAVKTRLHKARSRLRHELSNLWKEEMMATTRSQPVEMSVVDVRKEGADAEESGKYVVLLEQVEGTQKLHIWVGRTEGLTIAHLLEQEKTPRPLTIAFTASLVQRLGGKLQYVLINRLEEETFYAAATVAGPQGTVTVDARPSDAIALALSLGAPVRVEPTILTTAGVDTGERGTRHGAAEIVAEVRAHRHA